MNIFVIAIWMYIFGELYKETFQITLKATYIYIYNVYIQYNIFKVCPQIFIIEEINIINNYTSYV